MLAAIIFWYGIFVLFTFFAFITYPRRDNKRQNWIVGMAVAVLWPMMGGWFIVVRALPWIGCRLYADATALTKPKRVAMMPPQAERKEYTPGQWAE